MGCFRENHSKECPNPKIKGKLISYAFFNSLKEKENINIKKIIKIHLHGSRGQKDWTRLYIFELFFARINLLIIDISKSREYNIYLEKNKWT